MHALLLLFSPAFAADPSLADLDAAAARARALPISGPAPGQKLTQKQESELLTAQLRARAQAVQEVERLASALIQSPDPQVQVAALLRLGWARVELAQAMRDSAVPRWLTPEQAELYGLQLEDRVFSILDSTSTAVLQAEGLAPPGSPESTELLRLYLALRHDPGPALEHVCAPPPPQGRGPDPRVLSASLVAGRAHMQSDLQAYGSCLPPDLVEELSLVDEQVALVIHERDASMVADILPFVDQVTGRVHEALPTACGVTDHPTTAARPAPAPPEPAPAAPRPTPVATPITDLAGQRAALELAAAQPQEAPQPSCLRGPPTDEAGLRLGALRSVELASQGLTGPAAHRALADAFFQASRDLGAPLPAAGLLTPSAEVARQAAGARWAAARADQHLWAIVMDERATEDERREAQSDLLELTRWRLLLEATQPPEPPDPRRVEY